MKSVKIELFGILLLLAAILFRDSAGGLALALLGVGLILGLVGLLRND